MAGFQVPFSCSDFSVFLKKKKKRNIYPFFQNSSEVVPKYVNVYVSTGVSPFTERGARAAGSVLRGEGPGTVRASDNLLFTKPFVCLWLDFISTHWPTFFQVLSRSPELLSTAALSFLPARSHGGGEGRSSQASINSYETNSPQEKTHFCHFCVCFFFF